jgi:hypothetical protein
LGLAVVAEGAEEFEQIGSLRELGCDQVQGYFIHRPMPFNDANDWLQHKPLRIPTRGMLTHTATKNSSAEKIKAAANDELAQQCAKPNLATALYLQQEFNDPRFSITPRGKSRSA